MPNKPTLRFEKVTFEEYRKYFEADEKLDDNQLEAVKKSYDEIILPSRATTCSAGYDFFMPFDMCYNTDEHESVLIPTGIRVYMDTDNVLLIMPRSGLGTRYGFRLLNTVGVIDSDYYNADNQGHILCACTSDKSFNIHAGEAFMQGLFLPYFKTTNDEPRAHRRIGGFGSTTKAAGAK